MRTCAELAELAMHCARIAAARAAAEPPPPAPAPSDPPQTPAPRATRPTRSHEPEPEQPEATLAALRHSLTAAFVAPAGGQTIDPLLLFARLAAIVRACLALETRLAAILAQAAKSIPNMNVSAKPASLAPGTIAAPAPAAAGQPPPSSRPTPKPEGAQARRLCETTSLSSAPRLDFAPAPMPTILPGLGHAPAPIPRATDPPRPGGD